MAELILPNKSLIGIEPKAHKEEDKIIKNESIKIGDVVLRVRVGMTSVSDGRWRVWYTPIFPDPNVRNVFEEKRTYVTAPPGGFEAQRAGVVALATARQIQVTIDMCVEQVAVDANEAIEKAKAALPTNEG